MNQHTKRALERATAIANLPKGISDKEAFALLKENGMFDTYDAYVSYLKRQISNPMEGITEAVQKQEKKTAHAALEAECEAVGIPIDNASHYWYKGKSFSVFVKKQTTDFWEKADGFIAKVQDAAPKYAKYERPSKMENPHALVLDPADIHIGKLSSLTETKDAYDPQIAIARVHQGVEGILQKSFPYNIEKVYFIIGNDVLHTDNTKRTTTAGTPQDTQGMWYDNYCLALDMYIEVINVCLGLADVHVVFNPSNHDYTTGFFLAQSLKAYFSKSQNVTFDVDISHRKYFQYGNSLIGTTHGDGAKMGDLSSLMAHEARDMWATSKYRYFYVHHFHHKIAKDYMSVTVESLRTSSGTDSWHHVKGYQHAPKAIEGFIHSQNHGRVASICHYF